MTAVRNTLEETMTKQEEEEVGYGAIEDTNTPETKTTLDQLTTTRTTYGMLLLVMSVFLVIGASAGATRSFLRSDTATASIVVKPESGEPFDPAATYTCVDKTCTAEERCCATIFGPGCVQGYLLRCDEIIPNPYWAW